MKNLCKRCGKHLLNCDCPPVPIRVEIGTEQPVSIIKMFGPTIFADLRITANLQRGAWIVERMGKDVFEEVAAIPAQLDSDFEEDSETTLSSGVESKDGSGMAQTGNAISSGGQHGPALLAVAPEENSNTAAKLDAVSGDSVPPAQFNLDSTPPTMADRSSQEDACADNLAKVEEGAKPSESAPVQPLADRADVNKTIVCPDLSGPVTMIEGEANPEIRIPGRVIDFMPAPDVIEAFARSIDHAVRKRMAEITGPVTDDYINRSVTRQKWIEFPHEERFYFGATLLLTVDYLKMEIRTEVKL